MPPRAAKQQEAQKLKGDEAGVIVREVLPRCLRKNCPKHERHLTPGNEQVVVEREVSEGLE